MRVEAVFGFALLSASVSWILSAYLVIVVLLVMRRFISPVGNLLNSFLEPTALLPASNRFHGSATKEG